MEDRELLELAARASGRHYNPTRIDPRGLWCVVDGEPQEVQEIWNPLDDDGDAYQLAHQMGLPWRNRRQVVKDAAEIGKAIK